MAVKDGLPSTDFSRQNREYIKELIEESAGGGGTEILMVTITEEESGDDNIYTFSPSIDDIIAAKEAGKLIMGMYDGGTPTMQVDCYKNAADDWEISVIFPSFSIEENGIHIYIDTYAQKNSDASMSYDSAEGIVTAI